MSKSPGIRIDIKKECGTVETIDLSDAFDDLGVFDDSRINEVIQRITASPLMSQRANDVVLWFVRDSAGHKFDLPAVDFSSLLLHGMLEGYLKELLTYGRSNEKAIMLSSVLSYDGVVDIYDYIARFEPSCLSVERYTAYFDAETQPHHGKPQDISIGLYTDDLGDCGRLVLCAIFRGEKLSRKSALDISYNAFSSYSNNAALVHEAAIELSMAFGSFIHRVDKHNLGAFLDQVTDAHARTLIGQSEQIPPDVREYLSASRAQRKLKTITQKESKEETCIGL